VSLRPITLAITLEVPEPEPALSIQTVEPFFSGQRQKLNESWCLHV
jgi:hypothetical protein